MEVQPIESILEKALSRHLHGTDGHLIESIRYSLLAPGKRIRPRLLLACAEMLDLPVKQALPAAAALEMIHCFTLIHDDLPCLDNDDFRRGKPSNHKIFGESTALLAGDALIPLALEVFLDSEAEPRVLIKALKRLLWASGPRGVIGGQAAEMTLNEHSGLADLKQMHRQKTGALFAAALLIPKDLSGITDQSPQGLAISYFSDELGLAFQAMDDLHDQKQDQIPGTQAMKPLSILSHLSKAEVCKSTTEALHSAKDRLISLWGVKATPLAEAADEILNQITTESTSPESTSIDQHKGSD